MGPGGHGTSGTRDPLPLAARRRHGCSGRGRPDDRLPLSRPRCGATPGCETASGRRRVTARSTGRRTRRGGNDRVYRPGRRRSPGSVRSARHDCRLARDDRPYVAGNEPADHRRDLLRCRARRSRTARPPLTYVAAPRRYGETAPPGRPGHPARTEPDRADRSGAARPRGRSTGHVRRTHVRCRGVVSDHRGTGPAGEAGGAIHGAAPAPDGPPYLRFGEPHEPRGPPGIRNRGPCDNGLRELHAGRNLAAAATGDGDALSR